MRQVVDSAEPRECLTIRELWSAARAAWPTDQGGLIAEGLVASLRGAGLILPLPDTIERAGLAGRARARKRAADALLAGLSHEQLASLDAYVAVDPERGRAPLTWAKDAPSAPKAEHVREILDKLRAVRALGLDPAAGERIHPDRLRLLAREGCITPAYAIECYTPLRRRAILVATLLDLDRRLTDAALGMADRLIGASFTRGNNARERTYTAPSRDVGRLMRLLHGTAVGPRRRSTAGIREPWAIFRRMDGRSRYACKCAAFDASVRPVPAGSFAERLDANIAEPWGRRSARLQGIVHHVGLALGGRPGQNLARRLLLPVSKDTLLRVVRRRGQTRPVPPTVIGIDWAWRRNQRYGTLICDLERRKTIALLPDREPATAEAWLTAQPQIEIVARDRGGA